jgi:hypothetical protein
LSLSKPLSPQPIKLIGDETEDNNKQVRATVNNTSNDKSHSNRYAQQQAYNSTSSTDDDPQQQKRKSMASNTKQRPLKLTAHPVKLVPQLRKISAQDKREMKQKKLHKRSKRTKYVKI